MSVNTLRSSLSLDMQAALEGPLREPAEEDEEIYNHAQGHRILLEKKGRGRKRSKGGTIAASQQRAPESPEKSKAVLFSTRFANFLQSWHMEYYVWGLTAFTITVIILNVWLTSRIWKYEKEDPWEQADVENRECRSAECHASLAFSYIERVMVNVFFVEILLKVAFLRREFFKEPYNCYDAFVCVAAWVFWVFAVGFAYAGPGLDHSDVVESVARKLTIFRMVRLTRMASVVGWVPALHELWLLISAFGNSLKILIFGMVLFVILCMSFAAIMTTVVNSDEDKFPRKLCKEFIRTWPRTQLRMYTCELEEIGPLSRETINNLAQDTVTDPDGLCATCQNFYMYRDSFISFMRLCTLEEWPTMVDSVTRRRPQTAFIFAVFLGVSAYGVVNLLTAVLVDSALAVSGGMEALDRVDALRSLHGLKKIFSAAKRRSRTTLGSSLQNPQSSPPSNANRATPSEGRLARRDARDSTGNRSTPTPQNLSGNPAVDAAALRQMFAESRRRSGAPEGGSSSDIEAQHPIAAAARRRNRAATVVSPERERDRAIGSSIMSEGACGSAAVFSEDGQGGASSIESSSNTVTWSMLKEMMKTTDKLQKILDRFGLDVTDLKRVYQVSLFEMHPLNSRNLNRTDDAGVPLWLLVENMQRFKDQGNATPRDLLDILSHVPSMKLQLLMLSRDVHDSVQHVDVLQKSLIKAEQRLARTEGLLMDISEALDRADAQRQGQGPSESRGAAVRGRTEGVTPPARDPHTQSYKRSRSLGGGSSFSGERR